MLLSNGAELLARNVLNSNTNKTCLNLQTIFTEYIHDNGKKKVSTVVSI